MRRYDRLLKIAYWTLPCALYNRISRLTEVEDPDALSAVSKNSQYRNTHNGKRCFILCNGPSVKQQDLIPLKDEIVFSVSGGYLHKDYHIIKPKYHCVPQLTYSELFTKETAVKWFREMESQLTDTELFLSYSEYDLVKEYNLFSKININYVYLNATFHNQTEIIDIAKAIPRVQSVPIMCLIIAMYMGFNKIYLIGTEHDSFRTGDYKYFYTPKVLANTGFNVGSGDKINSLYEELRGSTILWEQYRAIKKIALARNITIFNATLGGALDEFERVDLQKILTSGQKGPAN